MLGGPGIPLSLRGKLGNVIDLPAGVSYLIPAGKYYLTLGPYTCFQFLDPVTNIWRTVGTNAGDSPNLIEVDGANYRLANLTGCPVAACITTATLTGALTGIGTTATAVGTIVSAGGSKWNPIVGGAISLTSVTGVTGSTPGAGYLFAPTIVISPPPPGGLQATAHATVTGGTLLAAQITIDNQGAGYSLKSTGLANATITVINDPRDTVGAGCAVQLGLTGTGLLTGLYPTDQGTPLTATPTLTLTAAAVTGIAGVTPIMNYTVTAITSGSTNTATYATGTTPIVTSVGNIFATAPAWTNPIHEKQSTFPRPCRIQAGLVSNLVSGTGAVVEDGGFGIQAVPSLLVIGQLLAITGVTGNILPTATVGGVTDTSFLQPL